MLQAARAQAEYPVLAPTGLSEQWRPTSARFDATDGSSTWFLGYVTPEGQYVAVTQTDGDPADFISEQTVQAFRTARAHHRRPAMAAIRLRRPALPGPHGRHVDHGCDRHGVLEALEQLENSRRDHADAAGPVAASRHAPELPGTGSTASGQVWVSGEISKIRSSRGQTYFTRDEQGRSAPT